MVFPYEGFMEYLAESRDHIASLRAFSASVIGQKQWLAGRAGRARLRHTSITMGDRPAATNADGVARNDQRRRQLPAFEFIGGRFNSIKNFVNQIRVMTRGDDCFRRLLLFEIQLQNRI